MVSSRHAANSSVSTASCRVALLACQVPRLVADAAQVGDQGKWQDLAEDRVALSAVLVDVAVAKGEGHGGASDVPHVKVPGRIEVLGVPLF